MELDPIYCGMAINRCQYYKGLDAIHEASGKTYYELKNAVETKKWA